MIDFLWGLAVDEELLIVTTSVSMIMISIISLFVTLINFTGSMYS